MLTKWIIALWIVAFTMGVVFAPIFTGVSHAFGEQDGFWSASEKRQIINLLTDIRDNTGE